MKCQCGANHRTDKCQFNKDPERRKKHNQLTAEKNRRLRSDPITRKKLNERDNERRRIRRQNPQWRKHELETTRKRLQDPEKYARKLETNRAYYQRLKQSGIIKPKTIRKSKKKHKSNYDSNASKKYYQNIKQHKPDKYRKRLEQTRVYGFEYRKKDRLNTINHYGAKCACCGETTLEFI